MASKNNSPMNFAEAARNKKGVATPNTKGQPMNIPRIKLDVTPKMNFKTAFAMARKKYIAGGGKEKDFTFTWEGNKYNVLRGDDKGESNAAKKKSLKAQIDARKQGGKPPRGASITKAQAKKIVEGNMDGMIPSSTQRKINPTTGMAMKKGGMIDMRKAGMFYGGMAKRKMK